VRLQKITCAQTAALCAERHHILLPPRGILLFRAHGEGGERTAVGAGEVDVDVLSGLGGEVGGEFADGGARGRGGGSGVNQLGKMSRQKGE
jgi:hypothetical protein